MKINRLRTSVLVILLILFFVTGDIQDTVIEKDNGEIPEKPVLYFDDPISTIYASLTTNISTEYKVSSNTGSGQINAPQDPEIVVDSEKNIHIVWADKSSGNWDILYRNYSYQDQQWNDIVTLEDADGDQKDPSIAVDDSQNMWVVWQNFTGGMSLEGKYYDAEQGTWSDTARIHECDGLFTQINTPKVASNGQMFTVAYQYSNITADYILYNNYMGSSWSENYTVPNPSNNDCKNPDIYFDQDNHGHLVYRIQSGTNEDIIYTNMTLVGGVYQFGLDSSGNFKAVNITSVLNDADTNEADYPSVIVDSGSNLIHIAWQDKVTSSYEQIRYISMDLEDYIDEELLDTEIKNFTTGNTYKRFPAMGFGFNSTNPSFVWSDGGLTETGKISFKESPYDTIEQFNQGTTNEVYTAQDPCITQDENNSLYVVYCATDSGVGNYNIWFRKYDVENPGLKVTSPVNNTLWNQNFDGNISLSVSTERDTRSVKYEYYNDDDENGLADDGNSWNLIAWINSTSNNFNTEWNTTENSLMDYPCILIRVTAYDENNLDDVVIVGNITIDNIGPNMVDFVDVTDELGNYADSSDTGNFKFGGTIDFQFSVDDAITSVDYVELYNGTNPIPLGSNTTNGNNANITIETESVNFQSNFGDGNYSALYLVAYDITGNQNHSENLVANIIIDNEKPTPVFQSPETDKRYKTSLIINVTTPSDDDIVSVKFYYTLVELPDTENFLGIAEYHNGGWNYTWNIASFLTNETTIKAQVLDNTGWETNITTTVWLDNLAPTPIILSPKPFDEAGALLDVIVQTDIDVVAVSLWNSTQEFTLDWTIADYTMIYSSMNATHKNWTLQFYTTNLVAGNAHFIKVQAWDTLYNVTSDTVRILISEKVPGEIRSFELQKVTFDSTSKTYNVTLQWNSPNSANGKNLNITHYLIYRVSYDYSLINPNFINDLNIFEREAYLGIEEGEGFCVEKYEVEMIYDGLVHSYEWTDTGVSAASYYYLVISVNFVDLQSNCSTVLNVKIDPEMPTTLKRDTTIMRSMPFIYAFTAVILGVITSVSVSAARRRRRKREVGQIIQEIDEDKFKETGEKSLEERLDEMESMAEISIKEDLGMEAPQLIKSSDDIDLQEKFLEMDVGKIAKSTEIKGEVSGPTRCPHCNWIVSSTAVKCPRCGKVL